MEERHEIEMGIAIQNHRFFAGNRATTADPDYVFRNVFRLFGSSGNRRSPDDVHLGVVYFGLCLLCVHFNEIGH
ncbi:hypothetical protein D3C76_1542290 [compost metagenome]